MIGYYVHHQGDGHATRATAIARRLGDERVAGLSSRPRPGAWTGPWVQLARDDHGPISEASDPTAGGALHWSPARHAGLRDRMAQIAAWVAEHAPRLVVVDVSVEVAVLVRSMGVPVVVMGMPGVREDAAHQLAYRLADAILAPWPDWASLLVGGEAWQDKLHTVGAISRFEDRARTGSRPSGGRKVLVLSGRGGTALTEQALTAAQHATPQWEWTVLGPPSAHWVADPWPLLCDADVVVTHAGQNAIADVAAARRPAIVIPQERPHREQRTTADAVRDGGLAVVCSRWPEPDAWPSLLAEAERRGGEPWVRWTSGSGAARAAAVLEELMCAPR